MGDVFPFSAISPSPLFFPRYIRFEVYDYGIEKEKYSGGGRFKGNDYLNDTEIMVLKTDFSVYEKAKKGKRHGGVRKAPLIKVH